MLIDEYLPQYDVVERHATVVRASAARVYAALRTADLAASPLVRLLLALRALPAVLRDGGNSVQHLRTRMAAPITLQAFEEQEFPGRDPAARTADGPCGHVLDVAGWHAARRCGHLSCGAASGDSPGGLELRHQGGGRWALSALNRNPRAVCGCGESPTLSVLLVGDSTGQWPHPALHVAGDSARGGAWAHLTLALGSHGRRILVL